MTRHALPLLLLLATLACGRTSDGLTGGAAARPDLGSATSGDGSTRGPDLLPPANPEGGDCRTACDCEPGLACRRGTCSMSSRSPAFCCSSTSCPEGEACETAGGDEGVCGAAPANPDLSSGRRDGGPGRDGGFPDGGSRDGGPRRDGGFPDGGSRDGGWGRDGGFPDGGSRDGGWGRDGGRPGDASTGHCAAVLCVTDQGCQLVGCGACDRTTGRCR